MSRRKHPKSEIEAALKHAEDKGWTIKVNKKGHAWGKMLCPFNDETCRCGIYCIRSIWSTPKNANDHAENLRTAVDKCIRLNQSSGEDDG